MANVLRALLAVAVLSSPLASAAGGQTRVSIEGTVAVAAGPAKRTAPRYPSGGVSARDMQPVAAVVYLVGEGLGSGPGVAEVELLQRDTAFVPSAIAVRTGTVVRFANADPFFHNVFSYARNARFDLGRYPEGESRQVAFTEPGIARVFCEVHEFMRAVVVVTDHPFHAVVAEDGTFRLDGVPPGEYTLVAYHPDLGSIEQAVVAREGERARVDLELGGAGPPQR